MSTTELLRVLYGEPMEILASTLRGSIIAPPGAEFFCGDYAAIEARKLFWMAEHERGVTAFHNNAPMYEEMAQIIFNVKNIEDITPDQRFVGKQIVLGAGYGLGWKKFMSMCEKFGKPVSEETAKLAVSAYRRHHSPVPKLWGNYERAAISAVQNFGKSYTINKCCFFMRTVGGVPFLYIRLPSGRCLAYYRPSIRWEKTPWGEKRSVLYHFGADPKTKKWRLSKTWGGTLTENVVQAVARDFMAAAMLRCERAGYHVGLSVHDELLTWREKGKGTVPEFIALMVERPAWAAGAPVKVEAWTGTRYRKG